MLGFNLSVGRNRQSFGDADAQAFIAATGLTGTTETTAVRRLVANLKTYGLWSKMKAIYPFVSDTINNFSYTEDLTNGAWQKVTTVATPNATTAPDGTNTGWMITGGNIRQILSTVGNNSYTCYVKKKTNRYFFCTIYAGGVDNVVWGDLDTGTITLTQNNVSNASLTSVGNGWYKFTFNFNVTNISTEVWLPMCCTASGSFTRGTDIYLWHPQFENGLSFSAYQPIATTPANRFVSQFKYNLKDPRDLDAAFRLAFSGTWTYTKQGATPNGVNGYCNTYLNPVAQGLTTASAHLSYYARTSASTSDPAEMGNYTNNSVGFVIQSRSSLGTSLYYYSYPIGASRAVATAPTGLMAGSSIANTRRDLYLNGVSVANNTSTDNGTLGNYNLYIGAANINNTSAASYTNSQTGFSSIGNGLTDSEMANYYTSVQTFQQDLSRQVGVPIVSDSDAQSFLNAAVITDTTQANAINTLVVGLKNASLWTKMKAIYPFVGGTATTHKWNLKDPRDLDAAYRLAFFGSWTHSSTGITGNGISTYAITYLNPSINLPSSQNSSIYLRTYATGGSSYPKQFAAQASPRFNYMGGANHLESYMGANTTVINDGTNTIGYFSAGGDNTLVYRKYRNNARITKADVYLGANTNMNIGDSQANFTTACNISFFNIGDSLTDSEISSVYTLVQNFQTTLGRQV